MIDINLRTNATPDHATRALEDMEADKVVGQERQVSDQPSQEAVAEGRVF